MDARLTGRALLEAQAAELPASPGVYLFKDKRDKVIYVGKALSLRARVRQYLSGQDQRFMIPFLVARSAAVDFVVTRTEKEALLLENTLIKQHRPRFNVKLVDDKNFLHMRIDSRERWPRFRMVRQMREDGARYFGPYHSASQARQTAATLQRTFPLRTCSDRVLASRQRPCLLHQLGRCAAPCVGLITEADYAELVQQSVHFLEGRHGPVVAHLKRRMMDAAEAEEFERAARLRDTIASIERSVERQAVIDPKLADRDIWGLFRAGAQGAVAVLPVRGGAMGQSRARVLDHVAGEDGELLSSVLNMAYMAGADIPAEILVSVLPDDHEAIADVLSERRGAKVTLHAPQRGGKERMIALAVENARLRLHAETDADARHLAAMDQLARVLELPKPPERMECFDNSNLGGTNPVAAMAVFIDGKPARGEYRRYLVKEAAGGDDYGMMREILSRRVLRAQKDGLWPDLLVVDGGKGQLGVAVAVLGELGARHLPVIGISKPRTEHKRGERQATDKIVLPNRKEPIKLREGDAALRILQHLRDETHRTAIRYQRDVRSRRSLASVLEAIPGVGPSRRTALLRALGSAEAVAEADEEVLAAVPGIGPALASQIFAALHDNSLDGEESADDSAGGAETG